MGSNRPLSSLTHLFDALVLEHLDQVLLNSTLDHSCILLGWTVLDWSLVSNLSSVCREELFPVLGIGQVKVH